MYNPHLVYYYQKPEYNIMSLDYWVITHNIPKEKFIYFEAQGITWVKEENLLAALQEYPHVLKWYFQCCKALEYCSKPVGWHIASYVASCISSLEPNSVLEIPQLKVRSISKFLDYMCNPPAEEVYEAIALLYRRIFFSDLAKDLNTEGRRFYRHCFHVESLKEVITELKRSDGFIISDLTLVDKTITPEVIYKILFEPQEPALDYFEYPLDYPEKSYNKIISDPDHAESPPLMI
jgi:hypothetical protein